MVVTYERHLSFPLQPRLKCSGERYLKLLIYFKRAAACGCTMLLMCVHCLNGLNTENDFPSGMNTNQIKFSLSNQSSLYACLSPSLKKKLQLIRYFQWVCRISRVLFIHSRMNKNSKTKKAIIVLLKTELDQI